MPTLNELLDKKAARLESVPGKFASQVSEVQKGLIKDVQVILARFELERDGTFKVNEFNIELAAELDVLLRQVLDASEYTEAVTEFAREFNQQISVNDAYFQKAFPGFETSELGALVVREAQKNAVELLINTSLDSEFTLAIKQQIEQAVITGARFRETLDTIQQIVTGNAETDGKILAYSKQIAHDTFAVGDRAYSTAVAEKVGATWFKYSGGQIKTSRPFCVERHGKFFCKKEIELWGAGEKTSGYKWPQSGSWAGEGEGTNERTIFTWAGGYNCMHTIMAVSIKGVPIEDVRRAIDLGYYEPTQFEVDQLGL